MITKKQLENVNETLEFLIHNYEWFSEYEDEVRLDEDLLIKAKENNKSDLKMIQLPLPGEHQYFEIEINEFLDLSEELKEIKLEVGNSLVKTPLRRYYIVDVNESERLQIRNHRNDFLIRVDDGIEIKAINNSLIIGLVAIQIKAYDEDLWGVISPYSAIEIKYETADKILTSKEEISLIKSFIFEVADTTGIVLSRSKIYVPHFFDEDDFEEDYNSELPTQQLRDLEPYNEGMKLFISAIQILEVELKFLNFYKILEHFAPVAVNVEASELMRKKLDAPRGSYDKGDFIRSIFALAKSIRDKFNDEDLIKATFNTCFDFVGLFELLPESVKKKVKKTDWRAEFKLRN